jgi:hypothetical protein
MIPADENFVLSSQNEAQNKASHAYGTVDILDTKPEYIKM